MRWGLLTSVRAFAAEDGSGAEAHAQEAPAATENAGQEGPGESDAQATENSGEGVDQPSGEQTEEPVPQKKSAGDRRFATLTAKNAAMRAELETAKRELAAATALANVGKEPTPNPQGDVEAAAQRIVAQREAQSRLNAVIDKGQKEFSDWGPKTEVLASMGATDNAAFMEALLEMPNATKIVAHLSDDVDTLNSLLGKSPAAMAAAMGRLDAELGRAPVQPLSNAPRPTKPITTPAVVAEPDIHDEKLSMAEWVKLRNKQAPRHLGGRR